MADKIKASKEEKRLARKVKWLEEKIEGLEIKAEKSRFVCIRLGGERCTGLK